MKVAKIIPIAMSALIVGSIATATTANAAKEISTEKEQARPAFIKTVGTVDTVEVRNDVSYYTINEGENTNILAVGYDTFVFDNTGKKFDNTGKKVELKKGDKVVAYTDANKPMILIFPPQYSPEVVIVETEALGFAEVGTFDKNLLDDNLSLKLNVSDETELISLSGKKVQLADLAEQNLLVFYTSTTKSIPAQTTPHKVVVLDQKESEQEMTFNPIIAEIIAKDSYEVSGTQMVPLRLLAEELGYKVDATNNGAVLSKETQTYIITRGQKAYSHNKDLHHFEIAPALLVPGKTYVPVQFIEELMNNLK